MLEFVIRLSKRLQTYSEQNFNTYQSAYDSKGITHLYTWPKNELMNTSQPEFSYSYQTNEYGFIFNQDLDSCNRDSTFIFLGDSFTFGVGSSQDSSLPVLLDEKIDQTVINAGIPGSDPFYQEKLIDSIFTPLGFKKYIIMLNFSDVYDFQIRGGSKRFVSKNQVEYRDKPLIEPFYKHSHLARAIIHGICKMDYSLLSKSKIHKLELEAIETYTNLLHSVSLRCDLRVILLPYPRQYANNRKSLEAIEKYKTISALGNSLKERSVTVYDLNNILYQQLNEENYTLYAWPIDGHYNAEGYELLANVLAKIFANEINQK